MTNREEIEEKQLFRRKQSQNSNMMFVTKGSAGNNNKKLAKALSVYDFFMQSLGWQDKDIANLSNIISGYQASIDTAYHNDFKDVLIAEEIERKREERKGISILQQ